MNQLRLILKSKVRFSRAFNSLFNFEGVETLSNKYGGVAQLGEHLLCKQGVIGSIPFISTKGWITTSKLNGLIAQVVRAHA